VWNARFSLERKLEGLNESIEGCVNLPSTSRNQNVSVFRWMRACRTEFHSRQTINHYPQGSFQVMLISLEIIAQKDGTVCIVSKDRK